MYMCKHQKRVSEGSIQALVMCWEQEQKNSKEGAI